MQNLKRICRLIILLVVCCLFVLCKKPRNGDYEIIRTGNLTSVNCYSATCDTTYKGTNYTRAVKIKNDGKQFFYVDNDSWARAGRSVSFYTVTSSRTPGSTSNYTLNYSGTIKNKFLIEGTYTINSIFSSTPHYYTDSETGNFTIKHKK